MNRPASKSNKPLTISHADGMSVCIAAYNEAATIGRLLQRLLDDISNGVVEVLVCVNGCTDDTESVVAQFVDRDPRFRLIVSPKGKPAAWNNLMQGARNDLRLFLDADVELAEDFLRAMRTAARSHPSAAIVAARDLPRSPVAGFRSCVAAVASRPFGFDYVCGRAYMLRASAMSGTVHPDVGQSDHFRGVMPLQVLAEDLWLEVYVGRDKIVFARDAHVYYEPGDVGDVLRTRTRLLIARRQIAAMLPDRFARWRSEFRDSSSLYARVRHRLRTMDDIRDATKCVAGAAVRSMLLVLNRNAVRRMEADMLRQMYREGGQAVLSGSGRINK